MAATLVAGPIAAERGTFVDTGEVAAVRLPWLFDGRALACQRPAPGLGEHTLEVLDELGYEAAQIEELRACGAVAVGQPDGARRVAA